MLRFFENSMTQKKLSYHGWAPRYSHAYLERIRSNLKSRNDFPKLGFSGAPRGLAHI